MKIRLYSHAELPEDLKQADPAGGAKYVVTLTPDERETLHALTHRGRIAARTLKRAQVLLKADEGEAGPGWTDEQIRAAADVSWSTIARVRRAFVEEGLEAAVWPRPQPPRPPSKMDGANEAHLVALTCSAPPAGRERWTVRLLADRFVTLEGDAISHETVRQILKKTR